MKRIFLIIFSIFLIGVSAFAQLNIKSTSSVTETFYKDTWATITWNGSKFLFNSSDASTAITLSFTLGKDKSSAITTLNQILDWFNTAEKKSSISFEDNGNNITLYKVDGLQIIITNGDAEFARKQYSQLMAGAFVGASQYRKKEATPHFSYIQKKALSKSIEAISALSDSKYSYAVSDTLTQSVQPKTETQEIQ